MRLIDADKIDTCSCVYDEPEEVCERIRNAPTVDAVLVVRCRDCKHARIPPASTNDVFCGYLTKWHKKDDFCSYGERRIDNAAD